MANRSSTRIPKKARVALSGAAAVMAGMLFAMTPWGIALDEAVGLDWLLKTRGPVTPPPEVAVVAFNRDTAAAFGLSHRPWEWSRTWHAKVIDELTARGASVIALDIAFENPRTPEEDQAFAAAIARSGRVILFERLQTARQPITDAQGTLKGWIWSEQMRPPLASFLRSAIGCAPFPLPKVAPTVRHFWAFKPGPDAATLPAVALQVHALDLHGAWLALLEQAGADGVHMLPKTAGEIGDALGLRAMMRRLRAMFRRDPALVDRISGILEGETPTAAVAALDPEQRRRLLALARLYRDEDVHYVNLYGSPGTIATVPYHALVATSSDARSEQPFDLAGKVVFVGSSDLNDPGQQDSFSTVFSRDDGVDLSGVEIAATAYANLATASSVRRVHGASAAAVLGVFGGIVGVSAAALSAPLAVPAVAGSAFVYGVVAHQAFSRAQLWLPLTTPLLVQVPFALLIGLLGQYLAARWERTQARRAVGYFLPETAVRDITERGLHPLAISREVHAVCLATDVESFTAVAESLTPGALSDLMNAYFETLAAAVQPHGADVCEFYADSIMAAWTTAGPSPETHRRACLAALDARDAIVRFSARFPESALPTRIGMHAGPVSLGAAGGGGRFVYGVRGDAANTASRIEHLNKQLGTALLASAAVTGECSGLLVRRCGVFQFIGKADGLAIGEILARREEADEELLALVDRFEEALTVFGQRRWDAAASLFKAILDDHPADMPSRFYLSRSRLYAIAPPEGDEGAIIRMQTK